MRVVTVTSLYPNAAQPRRGLFVRERLRQLQRHHPVSASVIAPVPWFPFHSARFGEYGVMGRVPSTESSAEGMVYHPRFFHMPKVSDIFSPASFATAVLREIRRRRVDFDVIDAHFLFPDGVAAVIVARSTGRPVLLTGRGSDVNLIAKEPIAGGWIRWALRRADGLAAVSCDLAQRMRQLSGRQDVEQIANGVDRERFELGDRAGSRERLGFSRFTVLTVGNLIDLKGHSLVIESLCRVPDADLIIVGDGPLRRSLATLAQSLGLADRVRILGALPQEQLAEVYRAADVLVLASSHEGMPNVVLESLASGTPVVATPTGGSQEALRGTRAGLLCSRSPAAIADAVLRMRAATPDRRLVRASVDRFDWKVCADRLNGTLRRLADLAPAK